MVERKHQEFLQSRTAAGATLFDVTTGNSGVCTEGLQPPEEELDSNDGHSGQLPPLAQERRTPRGAPHAAPADHAHSPQAQSLCSRALDRADGRLLPLPKGMAKEGSQCCCPPPLGPPTSSNDFWEI